MTRRDPYRRAMRRARRSWRNRDGAYPMLIIGPDEPVGLIVAGMIARWAWRHRSAFLPFTITGAAFATAAFAHPHHARWWITTACVTVFATVLLGIPHRLLVGTAGGPVHHRDCWPGYGPRAESTGQPNAPTRPSSSRAPADGFPPLSRSARPCGHCRKSR